MRLHWFSSSTLVVHSWRPLWFITKSADIGYSLMYAIFYSMVESVQTRLFEQVILVVLSMVSLGSSRLCRKRAEIILQSGKTYWSPFLLTNAICRSSLPLHVLLENHLVIIQADFDEKLMSVNAVSVLALVVVKW